MICWDRFWSSSSDDKNTAIWDCDDFVTVMYLTPDEEDNKEEEEEEEEDGEEEYADAKTKNEAECAMAIVIKRTRSTMSNIYFFSTGR